ncbi:hypothetical protein EXE53_15390 [Halorubrum sp. SD626R]|uniref:hypothetical protein n=1 Tax=Halorubrum sp. SD626R TaxID=1419722 RepID=UPI0010F9C1F7|nr:hypothetical protein [Halorubrum sp. SD626R]TKX79546.1 hypothetical protein EXE53_15390 [Halorubrum sp. SD626R]
MPVETTTEVGELSRVQDETGDRVPPANANRQAKIAATLGNRDGLTAGLVQPNDDTAVTLPAHSVPDGQEVLVQGAATNDGLVFVGDTEGQPVALRAAQGLRIPVTNTDQIAIRCPTADDKAAFILAGGDA